MSNGQDALRNFELKKSIDDLNPGSNVDTLTPGKKAATRNTTDDKEAKSDISSQSESGTKRGVDNLPPNLDGNRFPLDIRQPSVDGSLGDWRLQYKNLNYPAFEAKSGYTKPPIYPDDISKNNFNSSNLNNATQPVVDKIVTRKQYYNLYNDYAGKQFTHLLDYFSAQQGLGELRPIPTGVYSNGKTTEIDTKSIYLGSFIKTLDDNEDPTMLGYDIIIKSNESPLFNGTIDSFIQQFGDLGNTEIKSRSELLSKFKEQFNKFLKNDTSSNPTFDGGNGVKAYYLRKITGLNKLNDTSDSNETKQFIEYGKDFITLTFNEDVSQNLGYLGSLYKALSYSRLNGKQIIPENLLRFDVDIEITEIRKYNRVFKNQAENKLDFVADKISKYTYTLYECQLFFPNLPHNDTIDMSNVTPIDEYEIKFNYKWSTLKFSKFSYEVPENNSSGAIVNEYLIDNKYGITTQARSNATNNNGILDGSIVSANPTSDAVQTDSIDTQTGDKNQPANGRQGELESAKEAEAKKEIGSAEADSLVDNTTDATINPLKGGIGSIKDVLSKSAVQSTIDSVGGKVSQNFEKIAKNLEGTLASTIAPSFKRFSQDILGGEKLKKDILNSLVKEANRNIVNQAALLNKTLANISNGTFGVNRRVSPPDNVYSGGLGNNQLANDLTQAIDNFVGNSVRSFFNRR